MGRLFAIEIIYRGIYQKTLARNISRAIVLAAHKDGKPGISFGRYGDSPERNGIPAKSFAIVATDDMTLEEGMAKYEPKEVDITIAVDDTLCKGVESWAWYGLQPVNKLLKPGGTLIVTSREQPDKIIEMAHRKESPYQLAIIKGTPSFSGSWRSSKVRPAFPVCGCTKRTTPTCAFSAPLPKSCPRCSVSKQSRQPSSMSGKIPSKPLRRRGPTSGPPRSQCSRARAIR